MNIIGNYYKDSSSYILDIAQIDEQIPEVQTHMTTEQAAVKYGKEMAIASFER